MSTALPRYVLDADIFIQAYRLHYSFSLCPGFWACLPHFHNAGRIISIDRVRAEILPGDPLHEWAFKSAPDEFFAKTDTQEVVGTYKTIMQWVMAEGFTTEAKSEFARAADGWLVAFAKVHGYSVVTHEKHQVGAKARVMLPNLCRQFGVPDVRCWEMLNALNVQFHWTPPAQ